MNTNEQAQLEFETMQYKAHQHGFNLAHFNGFVLADLDSPCELHFENLLDVNNYIDVCDLTESEIKARYGFVTDCEVLD